MRQGSDEGFFVGWCALLDDAIWANLGTSWNLIPSVVLEDPMHFLEHQGEEDGL